MKLSPGSRIGPYEIVSPLGAGGMGEVYRARDTRLQRDVALKVLPDTFAAERDRLARFEREAQFLASLNHPHIGSIYGLEDYGDRRALVLELVEGPTLADRIAQGPIPIDEALPVARQIAEALEAAHEKGVIHRDLKPANIKLTPDGKVKVLDFGLAKLVDAGGTRGAGGGGGGLSMSPTIVSPAMMTGAGMILGTAAYMSPEQARGRPVDRRADIWAFGCVLYEMLTGRRAFDAGESVSDAVAALLTREPDWTALPATVPPHVRRALRRCLEKDVARRFRDVGDVALDLDAADRDAPARSAPSWQRFVVAGALGVAAVSIAAAWTIYSGRGESLPADPRQFHIAAPEGADFVYAVAMSPSGKELAVAGAIGDGGAIWIRPSESVDARRVGTQTGRPQSLFWSPDGKSLGFFEGGQLKVLNVATAQTRTIAPAPEGLGGTWGADDTILFAPDADGGIFRVNARGGDATPLTTPDRAKENSHRWPQFMPDGRRFIFIGWSARSTSGNDRFTIQLASLDAPSPVMLGGTASAAVYDPGGYLLFAHNVPPRLVAVPFDGTRIAGSAITIVEDFIYDWVSGRLPVTTARDGTLVYLNGRHEHVEPTWFDREGNRLAALAERGLYFDPAISHDGATAILEKSDPDVRSGDLWAFETASGAETRLTHDPTFDNVPVWSPDDREIAFSSDRDGLSHVFLTRADGTGPTRKVFGPAGIMAYATDWSRDGTHLLVTTYNEQRNRDVWLVPTGPQGQPRALLESRFEEEGAVFSPDGRWIAYMSNESGDVHVYVRPWPALDEATRISVGDGRQPQWRADGRELYYTTRDGAIMAVSIAPAGALRAGPPEQLFTTRLNLLQGIRNSYAASPDGRRFLVLAPLVDRRSSPITTILNWPALMR
jgi:Tol biopolymer transport system component